MQAESTPQGKAVGLLREWLDEKGIDCFEEPCAFDDDCFICVNGACGECLICRTRAFISGENPEAVEGTSGDSRGTTP